MVRFVKAIRSSSAYQVMSRDIKGHFSTAYLLTSEDALALEQLLLAVLPISYCPNGGCLSCNTCSSVLAGGVLDCKEVNPDGATLVVDDIEGLVDQTMLAAAEVGAQQIFALRNVDTFNEAVQNKLLKLLEDAKPNVHFLLTATKPQRVLATVLSRSKRVPLTPFSPMQIEEELVGEGAARDEAHRIASTCSGSLTLADRMLQPKFIVAFGEVIELLSGLSDSSIVTAISAKCFQKERISDTLYIMEIIAQGLIDIKRGADTYFPQISTLSAYVSLSYADIAKISNEIITAGRRVECNCVPTNVAHCLLMNILEVINANSNRS